MSRSRLMDAYMENLLQGNRQECRELVNDELKRGGEAETLIHQLLWPAMEQLQRMYREDRINIVVEHMASRINRVLADQVQRELPRQPVTGRRIIITCAEGESEELGAQMCSDLFESRGWQVYFLGGGVPSDEILALVGQVRPDILMVYGMNPQGVPGVRALIELIREVGVNPSMNILVTGGVFNRAEELWQEINADLYAASAKDALVVAADAEPRKPEVRIPGAPKKRRRRRRPALLAETGQVRS